MRFRFRYLTSRLASSPIVRGFMATLLGSGTSKLILVLATFLLANAMSKEDFGEFSFIRNTLNTVLCICALNFTSLCTKFTVEGQQERASFHRLCILFLFSIAISALIGLSLFLIPQRTLIQLFGNESLARAFCLIGLLLPLFILQPLIEGVLRGLMRFRLIGILQTSSSLIFIGVVFVGLKVSGLHGAVAGLLIYYLLYTLLSIIAVYILKPFTDWRSKMQGVWQERNVLPDMIVPIFVMSFFEAPVLWLAQLVLSKADSMSAVGSMTAIFQIRNIVILIPSYLFVTFTAFASKMSAEREFRAYFQKFDRLMGLVFLAGVLGALLLSILAEPILGLYGAAYRADSLPMIVSNIEIPLFMIIGLIKIDLVVQEHQKQLLYSSIAWNSLWLILLYAMLHLFSFPLLSFFISQLCALVVYTIWLIIIYHKDKKRLLYAAS